MPTSLLSLPSELLTLIALQAQRDEHSHRVQVSSTIHQGQEKHASNVKLQDRHLAYSRKVLNLSRTCPSLYHAALPALYEVSLHALIENNKPSWHSRALIGMGNNGHVLC